MIFDKWENLKNFSFSQECADIISDLYTLRKEVLNTAYIKDFTSLSGENFLQSFKEDHYPLRHSAFLNTMAFYSKKENVFEAHRKFVDIHFTIHGYERIEIASTSDIVKQKAHHENDIYNEEKDYILFTKPYRAQACVLLDNSNFLLAMPEDAHSCCLAPLPQSYKAMEHNQGSMNVTVKGIVKIPLNLFM